MKKICLFVLILFFVTSCGCNNKKIIKEIDSKLIIDIGMPSNGYVSTSPITGTTIILKKDQSFKLLKTIVGKNIKNSLVIENKNIVFYKGDKIYASSLGNTNIYLQSDNKKTKSNIINITVAE